MASINPVVLFEAKTAESAQSTQYTSRNVATWIDKFTATNVTSTAAKLTVNLVPAGGGAATSNIVSFQASVAAGAVFTFPELVGHILSPGDFISTLADTADALVIRASGRQIT